MKTYDLFRKIAGEMHQDFLLKYPKTSVTLVAIEDFCDENGDAHTTITKTAFS